MWAESHPKDTKGLKPTILNESPPAPEDESEDVKKHNEDMAKRHDKPHEQINEEKEKVDPEFWTGMFFSFSLFKLIFCDEANTVVGDAGKKPS